MSKSSKKTVMRLHGEHATLWSYVTGFALSICLTLAAYLLTQKHVNANHEWQSHELLVAAVLVLAVVQLAVQLVFFLHMSREPRPRMNGMAFVFAALVVLILGVGSLWIMANLDYHHPDMKTPNQTDAYIMDKEAIYK